ncbi:hypothetical protein [Amycolatopsis sp. lyj-109]
MGSLLSSAEIRSRYEEIVVMYASSLLDPAAESLKLVDMCGAALTP